MNPAAFSLAILITGATGLLGGALAADLLQTADWSKMLMLVRGEDRSHGEQMMIDFA